MNSKPIRLTRHAVQRALRYNLNPNNIEKIIREGDRKAEGKSKVRYVLRSKRTAWIAICREDPNQIVILTITKGGE